MAVDRAIGGCHCARCHARHGHLSLANIRDGLSQPPVVRAGDALTAGSPGCVAQARLIGLRTATTADTGHEAARGEAEADRQGGRRWVVGISIGDGDGGHELGMGEA